MAHIDGRGNEYEVKRVGVSQDRLPLPGMRFKHLHTISCHHCRLRRLSLALVLGLVETPLEASQVPTFQYLARLLLRHATRKTPCASLAAAYNSRSPAEPKLAFI